MLESDQEERSNGTVLSTTERTGIVTIMGRQCALQLQLLGSLAGRKTTSE